VRRLTSVQWLRKLHSTALTLQQLVSEGPATSSIAMVAGALVAGPSSLSFPSPPYLLVMREEVS
jgi:hypothetical protein